MAEVPTNEKLYAMVVTQAKTKYRIYPSPGASHWVHKRYLELGGKFEDSEKVAERKRMLAKYAERLHEMHDKHDDDDKHESKHDKKHEDK
jgi:hypothetical protein